MKKKKKNKGPDLPSRRDFYEYLNKARFEREQMLINAGLSNKKYRQ